MSEQADRYAVLWDRYKQGILTQSQLHEFAGLLVEQADRRDAGGPDVGGEDADRCPNDRSATRADAAASETAGLANPAPPASPSAYHRKLAKAIDKGISAVTLYSHTKAIAAVLASEGVVDPAEAERARSYDQDDYTRRLNHLRTEVKRLKTEPKMLPPTRAEDEVVVHLSDDDPHDGPCYYCGEPTVSPAGNPGLWPLMFCHSDDPGRMKHHHTRCVTERLADNARLPDAVRKRVQMATTEERERAAKIATRNPCRCAVLTTSQDWVHEDQCPHGIAAAIRADTKQKDSA